MMTAALLVHPSEPRYTPGDRVAGEIEVVEPGRWRRLSVEVRSIEASRGVVEIAVHASVELEIDVDGLRPGDRVPFALDLPTDLVRGFSTPGLTRMIELAVRADRLGPDALGTTGLAVEASPASATRAADFDEQVGAGSAGLAQANLIAGIALAGGGLAVALYGSTLDLEGRWVVIALGLVLLVCGAIATTANVLLGKRDALFAEVEVGAPTSVLAPGEPFELRIYNGGEQAVDVGLVTLQRRSELRRWREHAHQRSTHIDVLNADWRQVPPGVHTLSLSVPDDAPPSLAGPRSGIDHVVRVMREGASSSRLRRPHMDRRLIVV